MKIFRILFLVAITIILALPAYGQRYRIPGKHIINDIISDKTKKHGRHDPKDRMHLSFSLPLNNQKKLDAFLKQLNDPSHPNYRKYLSSEEFTKRFGPTQAEYDDVVSFAKRKGFGIKKIHKNRLIVELEGDTNTVEKAFNIQINDYKHPKENRRFFHPDREPTIDAPVKISRIGGLNNHTLPKPMEWYQPGQACVTLTGADPSPCTGSSPGGSFLGSDMRAAYYGGTTLTGAGQCVALLNFSAFDMRDVNLHFSYSGQPFGTVRVIPISVGGSATNKIPSTFMDNSRETNLDIYQAMSMAPGLKAVYIYVDTVNVDGSVMLNQIVSENRCKQISASWLWAEDDAAANEPIFQQMAAQGQTFFVASGDWKYWTKSSEHYPDSNPSVVSVGGTALETTAPGGSYVTEKGWTYSGGGIAGPNTNYTYAIPSWQQYTGVVTAENQASNTYRNGPDVAMEGNTSLLCNAGVCTEGHGGTSYAAPRWAGYMALINQQSVANGNGYLGTIHSTIYQIGVGENYNTNFNDVIGGNNGFPAVTGYDLVTGWGSPKPALINTLAGSPPNGMCGTAVNAPIPTTNTPPSSNLCTSGTASQVTCSSETNTCTWTCTEDGTPHYYVTPSAGEGGTISPSTPQYVITGSTVQFTYAADYGYDFQSWGGTCGGSGSVTYTTNAITANCTVTANFIQNETPESISSVRGTTIRGGSMR